jgi:hypothetical protein
MVSVITVEERDCNVISKAEEAILKQPVEKPTLNILTTPNLKD